LRRLIDVSFPKRLTNSFFLEISLAKVDNFNRIDQLLQASGTHVFCVAAFSERDCFFLSDSRKRGDNAFRCSLLSLEIIKKMGS